MWKNSMLYDSKSVESKTMKVEKRLVAANGWGEAKTDTGDS